MIDDIRQDIYLRILERDVSQPGIAYRIAECAVADFFRRAEPVESQSNEIEVSLAGLHQSHESGEIREEVSRLPEELRAVVHRRYWFDQPITEIAAETGLTVGQVKSRLSRAREILAKRLG